MQGRWFDEYLRVRDWESGYESVQKLLDHLSRRTKSESSRIQYLQTLGTLCRRESKTPDQLARLTRHEAEDAVQSYLDDMAKRGLSKRWVNVSMAQLITFFRANGFKKQRELELERQYMPVRYRKRPEYIPLASEINKMVIAGRNPSEKAAVLFVYQSGLRNSTARAVRYVDVKAELDSGLDVVHVPVRAGMKEVDQDAAKGRVEYDPFIGKEAVKAVKEHVRYVEGKIGRPFPPEWPLLPGQYLNGRPTKKGSLAEMVKRLARNAGIERWRDVYPHCLRKAFENAVRNSGLDWKDQEILMGHVLPGSMDTYLDKTRTEEFREKYGRVRFFPEGTVTRNEMLDAMRREILALAGYTEEETRKLGDLSRFTKEEMDGMIGEKWQQKMGLRNGQTQKVVARAEVRGYVEDGWEFVTWLDEQRSEAVVRLPK
jgi:site-specific recombinase XerD